MLLTRLDQGRDPDALAWAAAVVANGGTYSAATLLAQSNLVRGLKADGVWPKINRLNTFCGDQLAAALVPLKVGGGSATETNVNFVGGDYSEATGLTGNGATKYLRTGLVPSVSMTLNDTHLAGYNRSGGVIGFHMGCLSQFLLLAPNQGATTGFSDQYSGVAGAGRATGALTAPYGFVIGSRTAANAHTLYQNAGVINSETGSGGALPAVEIYVFAYNNAGAPTAFDGGVKGGYSIGSGLTAGDVTAYTTHMEAFQDTLGRGVA